jgi:hypothetical protein
MGVSDEDSNVIMEMVVMMMIVVAMLLLLLLLLMMMKAVIIVVGIMYNYLKVHKLSGKNLVVGCRLCTCQLY